MNEILKPSAGLMIINIVMIINGLLCLAAMYKAARLPVSTGRKVLLFLLIILLPLIGPINVLTVKKKM